jgi:hypothetical protein
MRKKVCFLSWHFKTPQIFLDSILKMTPGKKGVWGNIEAVVDPFQSDYCVIMDGYNGPFPSDRVIYFGEHPDCCSTSFRNWDGKDALVKLSLDKYLNPGEWWLSYDYDYLMTLPKPEKTKKLACVMTYQVHNAMYAQRPKFMQELVTKYPDISLDLYGRPQERFNSDSVLQKYYKGPLGFNNPDGTLGQHLVGKEILADYEYSIEIDVGPTRNYFSERFYDALLLWVHPIYFGSNNVHRWIPMEAFDYIDINNLNDVHKVQEVINRQEINYEAIEHARYSLLNKYQLWPYIEGVVNQL